MGREVHYLEGTVSRKRPRQIPDGYVLVHNFVPPTRRLSMRGFRAWLERRDAQRLQELEVCPCDWAPELGTHYRVPPRE